MSNSAHDEITLTVSEEDVGAYANLLANMKQQGHPGDAMNLVMLIAAIARAAERGDACVERTSVHLTHNDADVSLIFPIDVLQKSGWIEELDGVEQKYYSEKVPAVVSAAMQVGEFQVSFERPEYGGMPLSDLYNQMDLFTIGRPSTLPSILTILEEGQFIDVDKGHSEIKITDKGLLTYLSISSHWPDMATSLFCAELSTMQESICNGQLSTIEAMRKLLPKITGDNKAAFFAEQMWEDVADLYEESPSVLRQGLISIHKEK